MVVPTPHPEMGDLDLVRSPINLSKFPHAPSLERAAPDPGADGIDNLVDLGFGDEEITALCASGVIE
jgi:crotonobetainyl-CoA:carnitine CoA-transferase CaiB-like acyl-CoA transferase